MIEMFGDGELLGNTFSVFLLVSYRKNIHYQHDTMIPQVPMLLSDN